MGFNSVFKGLILPCFNSFNSFIFVGNPIVKLSFISIKLEDNKHNEPDAVSYSYRLNGTQEEKPYRTKKKNLRNPFFLNTSVRHWVSSSGRFEELFPSFSKI